MEAAGGAAAVEHVTDVGRSLVMEGFVGEEEDFELVALGSSGGSGGQG